MVWFSPDHDIATWYWREANDSGTCVNASNNDPMQHFLWQASQSQGALVRVRDFTQRDRGRDHSEELASFFQERPLYVCTGVIAIHTTASQAFRSQLWGTTGEEMIQLVDLMDTERLQKFSLEANPADIKAQSFLKSVVGQDAEALRKELKQVENSLKTRWVWRRWRSTWVNGVFDIPDPDQVWIGPRVDADGRRIRVFNPMTCTATDHFALNTNHPCVKKILDHMPAVRPAYMFRLCLLACHTLPPRPNRWGKEWLDEREKRKQELWKNSEEGRRVFERK